MAAISPLSSSMWVHYSGMRDARLRVNVTSHNVANLNTEGFVPNRVQSQAQTQGGVISVIEPGVPLEDPPVHHAMASSGTDWSTEGINLILAKSAYQANARILQTTAKSLHSLFG